MTDYMNVSPTPLTRRAMRLSRSPGRREATRSRFAEPVNAEPESSEPVLFAGHTRPEQFFFFCSSVWIGLPMVLVLFADTLGWRRRAWTSPTPWLAGLANLPASFVHWGDYHEHGRKQVVDVALAGLQLLTLLGETAYGCGWFASGAPDLAADAADAAADVANATADAAAAPTLLTAAAAAAPSPLLMASPEERQLLGVLWAALVVFAWLDVFHPVHSQQLLGYSTTSVTGTRLHVRRSPRPPARNSRRQLMITPRPPSASRAVPMPNIHSLFLVSDGRPPPRRRARRAAAAASPRPPPPLAQFGLRYLACSIGLIHSGWPAAYDAAAPVAASLHSMAILLAVAVAQYAACAAAARRWELPDTVGGRGLTSPQLVLGLAGSVGFFLLALAALQP